MGREAGSGHSQGDAGRCAGALRGRGCGEGGEGGSAHLLVRVLVELVGEHGGELVEAHDAHAEPHDVADADARIVYHGDSLPDSVEPRRDEEEDLSTPEYGMF